VDDVNIYDPRDGIVYRHLDQRDDTYSAPVIATPAIPTQVISTPAVHRLPIGYANASPSTYLRSNRRGASAA
jgi:hypothetical protein